MKRTLVFEVREDFEFPEKSSENKCFGCPMVVEIVEDWACLIKDRHLFHEFKCPFYGGIERVELVEDN